MHTANLSLHLSFHAVHVWQWSLCATADQLAQARTLLSADELARADRFHFAEHRRRFASGRATLRRLLGRYLDQPPQTIPFAVNAHGKPALAAAPIDLRFNLSHSRDMALAAFTLGRAIGIDVEYLDPQIDIDSLSRHAFSRHEQQALFALPPADQRAGFFACWTRKEAYVKARGQGLTIPLAEFDVSVDPHGPAELLACRNKPSELKRWRMQRLVVDGPYAATLVVEGDGWQLERYQLPL